MLKVWFLLGAAAPVDPNVLMEQAPPQTSGLALKDILLIVGIILLVAFLLFLWVYVTRKNKHPEYTEGGAKIIYRADEREGEHSGHRRKHRKRRPSHPDNLPRNPTLAEAGGLPPVRPEEPSEPAR